VVPSVETEAGTFGYITFDVKQKTARLNYKKGIDLLEYLLAVLPGAITGRVVPRARREVRAWTRGNITLRSLRYGWFRRLLMWGTERPVKFTFLVAMASALVGYLVAIQGWEPKWRLFPPTLSNDFDAAAYAGVPWTVQATLVALVYPIVLSFIALMLQRKAHSTVSLRTYVLDSGVVPAGATALCLIVVMGAEYFLVPYGSVAEIAKIMPFALTLNGVWLLINVLLTGFFLSRTIRFIQDEEQLHVFRRVAVDMVLRSELTSAWTQHIYVNAAQHDWGFPETGEGPKVFTLPLGDGTVGVTRSLKEDSVLHDVHLKLLHFVARRWSQRAAIDKPISVAKSPRLTFLPTIGEVVSGVRALCRVEYGPPLTLVERAIVRTAFCYRRSRPERLSLSAKNMLNELAGEVAAAAEQQRFGAAQSRLGDMVSLHTTLLLACAIETPTVADNAAVIGTSPFWGASSSFDIEWLRSYRDIGRIAVNHLDEDARLLSALAFTPANISAELPARPEKLLIDAQLVGANLAYQLGGWWTRKADASLTPGSTAFGGTLPAPLNKAYEAAVTDFIGHWGYLRVNVSDDGAKPDTEVWQELCAATQVYVEHIQHSTRMFLKAVARGDETASTWFMDNLLRWWDNRQHELELPNFEEDFRLRHVTLQLARKDWATAQDFLSDGSEAITINFARRALNLAIRKYWECMRLYVILLLIHNAGPQPDGENRELRLAAALVQGKTQRSRGRQVAAPLDNFDNVIRLVLSEIFGVETAVRRVDSFAESLQWENETPEVPGWMHSWSGSPADLESMKHELGILLTSLQVSAGRPVTFSKVCIQRWWRDVDKLESVQRYLQDLSSAVLARSLSAAAPVVAILQSHLQSPHRFRKGRVFVARNFQELWKATLRERQITLRTFAVDDKKVQKLREQISAAAFTSPMLSPWIGGVRFSQSAQSTRRSFTFDDEKKHYLEYIDNPARADLSDHIAEAVRRHVLFFSFFDAVSSAGLQPINNAALRDERKTSCGDARIFLECVVQRCSSIHEAGDKPIVLASPFATAAYFRPHKWGTFAWQCELPEKISIEDGIDTNCISSINGSPVVEYETPDGDCYVVSESFLSSLEVAGKDTTSGLSISWESLGEHRLRFNVSWEARFVGT
jgi:hypothetical protein